MSAVGDFGGGGAVRPASTPKGLRDVLAEEHLRFVIRRETSRADRTGRGFSVVLFRVKPPASRRRRASAAACRLARVLLNRVRETDDVGWFDERHLCAVLPETPTAGARVFATRACDEVARRHPRPVAVVYGYPCDPVTEARPADGAVVLRITPSAPVNGHSGANGDGIRLAAGLAVGQSALVQHPGGAPVAHANGANHRAVAVAGTPVAVAEAPPEAGRGLAEGERMRLVGYVLDSAACPTSAPAHESRVSDPALPDGRLEQFFVRPMTWPKRLLDLAGASAGIVLLAPLLAAAALAIKLTSRGPVIFTQRRAGLGGRPFTIYKFRTMCEGAERQQAELRKLNEQDGPAFKLTNDPRVTRVGHVLRRTSIDELPQLWNVLKGDMSLVGPRPLPVDEQEGCVHWQRHRLNVTPGLTCLWQVDGRGQVTFDEWVRMDVAYMRRQSVWHDLTILLRTIPAVLLRRGAR